MNATRRREDAVTTSLREHVLTPLSRAAEIVEVERKEIEAERRAFVQFRDRVAGIETVATPRPEPRPALATGVDGRSPRALERVRGAFRETITSLDHYDEVYGETVEEFAASEFSPEVAAGLRGESAASFTDLYKATLVTAVDEAVETRETTHEHLDSELASVETHRATLAGMIDSLDGPAASPRYRSEFEDRLEEVTQTRQKEIHRQFPRTGADGHDLCQYLYREPDWTYPVLTAVTRFHATL
jgi:hypothetical protein